MFRREDDEHGSAPDSSEPSVAASQNSKRTSTSFHGTSPSFPIIRPDRLKTNPRPSTLPGVIGVAGLNRGPPPVVLKSSVVEDVLAQGRKLCGSEHRQGKKQDDLVADRSPLATPGRILAAVKQLDLEFACETLEQARQPNSAPELERFLSAVDSDGNSLLHCIVMAPSGGTEADAGLGTRILDLLVSSRANVNAVNVLGETPLLSCLRASPRQDMVRTLLQSQVDIDRADGVMGETALMEVACSGDADMCCLLLEWEADPMQRSQQGLTAWDVAKAAGNEQIAALMPECATGDGCEERCNRMDAAELEVIVHQLRAAVKSSDLHGVQNALSNLGDACVDCLSATDGSGRTLLHHAVEVPSAASADITRSLLTHAASLHAADVFGQLPLEIALAAGCKLKDRESFRVIKILLDARANPADVKTWRLDDVEGELQKASMMPEREELCHMLQEAGLDLQWLKPLRNLTAAGPMHDDVLEKDAAVAASTDASVELTMPEAKEDASFRPIARGSTNLRRRCDERNIPLELLGSFAATDVLRETDRLEALDLEQLRIEAREIAVNAERCYDRDEIVSRLKQAYIWKLLPLSALQAECKMRASHVISECQRGDDGAMKRKDLEEALAVATWGGSMKSQVLLEVCQARGIPADRFASIDAAAAVLQKIEDLQAKPLHDVRREYLEKGFAPRSNWQQLDYLKNLQDVLVWEGLPLSDLRQVCRQQGVNMRGDHRRPDLLRLLANASWEAMQVPIGRLENLSDACRLLYEFDEINSMSLQSAIMECRRHGYPVEKRPERYDLQERLRLAAVWSYMPSHELTIECAQYGVAVDDFVPRSLASSEDNSERKQSVLELFRAHFLQSKGFPVKQLANLEEAVNVAQAIEELQESDISNVREEYSRFKLPHEARLSKSEIIGRLRTFQIWQLFTLPELRKECREHKIEFARAEEQFRVEEYLKEELVRRLVKSFCQQAWKDRGVPSDRMGGFDACCKLLEDLDKLDKISEVECKLLYKGLGLEPENLKADTVLSRLQRVAVWRALPFHELRKECREARVQVPVVVPGDAIHRNLVERLARALWAPPPPKAAAAKPKKMNSVFVPPKIAKYFEIMQLPQNAKADDVKKAYRQLALQWHPDKNPGEFQEEAVRKFRTLTEAYEELCTFLKIK